MDELAEQEKQGKTGTPQFAEMKRRFGWNLMECVSMSSILEIWSRASRPDKNSKLLAKIVEDFGSVENFENNSRQSARCEDRLDDSLLRRGRQSADKRLDQ